MSERRSAFVEYFSNLKLGIVSTWKGLTLTGRYFRLPKVTMEYPEVRPQIPEGHRGTHLYEEEKCVVCLACAKACPVECITIDYQGRGKDAMIKAFDIDYTKCLFCNLCVEACNSDCLFMGPDYDMAAASRAGCLLHFARTKTPEELAEHVQLLEKKEAEKKAKAAAAAAAKKEAEAKQGKE